MTNTELKTKLDERQELKRLMDEAKAEIDRIDRELLAVLPMGKTIIGPYSATVGQQMRSSLDKEAVAAAGIDLAPFMVVKPTKVSLKVC